MSSHGENSNPWESREIHYPSHLCPLESKNPRPTTLAENSLTRVESPRTGARGMLARSVRFLSHPFGKHDSSPQRLFMRTGSF